MKVTVKKLECRNISYAGYATKIVGSISQAVQIVRDGVTNGTMHLKAKVVRNLTNLYGVDCVASKKLYKLLTDNDTNDAYNAFIYNTAASPKSIKRKKRKKASDVNISFTSSLMSSPASTPYKAPAAAQVQSFPTNLISPTPGQAAAEGGNVPTEPKPSFFTPAQALNTYLNPPEPAIKPNPPTTKPRAPLQLENLIFCGLRSPCSCLDQCRGSQLEVLPPHYPVYLLVHHAPCGPNCGGHHVHGDNQHPPDSRLCPCDPPRLDPRLVIGALQVPYDDPPLPPDFEPCGPYCSYEECGCLRRYEGRDWIS